MGSRSVTALHVLVVIYFVAYLILLVYLILNMKLAAVYSSWQEVHELQLRRARIHRGHGRAPPLGGAGRGAVLQPQGVLHPLDAHLKKRGRRSPRGQAVKNPRVGEATPS